ncbi:MAG: hypothetical protein KIT84_25485 [Labilithrix sp.]|nr:hypothetical protein [Labilithrix sp.]MCW5814405.1 hypothetical protein [Labilithrix sp.]
MSGRGKIRSGVVAAAFLALAGAGACGDAGFPTPRGGPQLTVELIDADEVAGTRLRPRPLKVNVPEGFKVKVRALDARGNVDTSYNGYVRMSSKPGAIDPIDSPDAEGRNLKLTNGESPEVEIRVTNAFGATFILAEDQGYAPADPVSKPPPACADGIDNDGDGRVDFPADEGCAFANDNTEEPGSYSTGATQPIYYALPRIADLRGLLCDAEGVCRGTGKSPYPREQLLIDTGLHEREDGSQRFDFDLVVTRIASDGFFVTDTKDGRGGYNSIFAFNFNAPPRMRVCDRLKTFNGTAAEFFGQTQIGYPTWTLEAWNPELRTCLVPEPFVLDPGGVLADTNNDGRVDVGADLPPNVGGLVRVITDPARNVEVKITSKFGAGKPEKSEQTKLYAFTPDASNCDFDNNGLIDFTAGNEEGICSTQCAVDPDCTEYSNFASRSTFRFYLRNTATGQAGAIQADATVSTEFKPLERKGQTIKSFTGTMTFFSGGSQYTIEARCPDDIVTDVNASPLPMDKACVAPRTDLDENPQ